MEVEAGVAPVIANLGGETRINSDTGGDTCNGHKDMSHRAAY